MEKEKDIFIFIAFLYGPALSSFQICYIYKPRCYFTMDAKTFSLWIVAV